METDISKTLEEPGSYAPLINLWNRRLYAPLVTPKFLFRILAFDNLEYKKSPELDPYTNQDVLSNSYTDNMYEYERRPTCSLMKPDCGSKFLFCHPVNGYLQCITKLRAGATCHGLEKTPICYEGECVAGRCVKNKTYLKRENLQTELYM